MSAAEELAYIDQMKDLSDLHNAQNEQYARLFSEQGDYPELLWNAVWNSRMHEALASIIQINEAYRSLVPPARYEHLHEIYLESADHSTKHVQFIALHLAMLQEGRPEEAIRILRQATSEHRLSNNAIQRATAVLQDML